jgi:S1-C subfamily serine protease
VKRGGVALIVVSLASLAIGPAPLLPRPIVAAPFWPPPVRSPERAAAITVRVDSRGGGAFDTGTGVAVGGSVVLTNAHLTNNPVTLVTRCGDREAVVAKLERSSEVDLAVLVVPGAGLPPVELAPRDPQPGDRVLLAGYPGGTFTLTDGRVEGAFVDNGHTVVRFSPEPEGGQSGSPLLDDSGRLVGLAFADEATGGQGLAIPVSTVRAVLDRFRDVGVPIAPESGGDPAAATPRTGSCG